MPSTGRGFSWWEGLAGPLPRQGSFGWAGVQRPAGLVGAGGSVGSGGLEGPGGRRGEGVKGVVGGW